MSGSSDTARPAVAAMAFRCASLCTRCNSACVAGRGGWTIRPRCFHAAAIPCITSARSTRSGWPEGVCDRRTDPYDED